MASEPAKRPCGSCPYRTDAPSGLWAYQEYTKLAEYDRPTGDQPPNLFDCHQATGRLCAGWVACHDMEENLAVRLAPHTGNLTPEEVEIVLNYTTDVPVFASGFEAMRHGLREYHEPSDKTLKTIEKLKRKRKDLV